MFRHFSVIRGRQAHISPTHKRFPRPGNTPPQTTKTDPIFLLKIQARIDAEHAKKKELEKKRAEGEVGQCCAVLGQAALSSKQIFSFVLNFPPSIPIMLNIRNCIICLNETFEFETGSAGGD